MKQIKIKTNKNSMFRLALKSLSYLASATMVLLASGFLTLRPVQHYPNVPTAQAMGQANCSDITQKLPLYSATPAIPNSDAGQFNFDAPGDEWQACVNEQPTENRIFSFGQAIPSAYFLQGWSWNTNFGDVSTNCEGGFNTTGAQQVACGGLNYGSYIVEDAGNTARIMGFSWNDQIGWIKMGCQGTTNTGVACGAINYGATIALEDGVDGGTCPNITRGDIFGYVYNDTVGYMNMCGTHIDLTNLDELPNPFDTSISATVTVDPNGPNNPSNTVFSNGSVAESNYYELDLSVTENGVPITVDGSNPDRRIVVSDPVITNTVKANQVTPCNDAADNPQNPALLACTYGAASVSAFVPDNAARPLMTAFVNSVAPTNDDNKVIVQSVTIQVRNGADEILTTKTVNIPGGDLSFAPPVEVTHIAGKDGNGETLIGESFQLTADQSTPLAIKAVAQDPNIMNITHNLVLIYSQLYSCTDSFDYIFGTPPAGTTITADEQTVPLNRFKSGVCSTGGKIIDVSIKPLNMFMGPAYEFLFSVFSKSTAVPVSSPDDVNKMAIQTVVNYALGGQTVSYYSRSLQGGAFNEFSGTKVDGNVNLSTISKDPEYQSWISAAVGDMFSSNREPYLRAVKAVLGSKTPMDFGSAPDSRGGEVGDPNGQTGEIKILKQEDLRPGILYYKHKNGSQFACTIIITQDPLIETTPVRVTGATTLVTEGCNIFIDRDIVAAKNGTVQVGNLGIIALADYKLNGTMKGGKGGNVYVCNTVTDIEANIVAEGSLYGTNGDTPTNCGTVYLNKRRAMLKPDGSPQAANMTKQLQDKQLTIMGSLMSNNTYGGSTKNPPELPLLGDGRIDTDPLRTLSAAQDLNRIRFGRTQSGDFFGDGDTTCWANGYVMSKLITDPLNINDVIAECDGGNGPSSKGTFNLQFRAPLPNQPIFSGL